MPCLTSREYSISKSLKSRTSSSEDSELYRNVSLKTSRFPDSVGRKMAGEGCGVGVEVDFFFVGAKVSFGSANVAYAAGKISTSSLSVLSESLSELSTSSINADFQSPLKVMGDMTCQQCRDCYIFLTLR